MPYYESCGWLPFGFGAIEASNVGKCGDGQELSDGKCKLSSDACGPGLQLKSGKCQIKIDDGALEDMQTSQDMLACVKFTREECEAVQDSSSQPICVWGDSGGRGSCQDSCELQTTSTSCVANTNCQWDADYGNSGLCFSACFGLDQEQCQAQPHCSSDGSRCSMDCGTFDMDTTEATCADKSHCTWVKQDSCEVK